MNVWLGRRRLLGELKKFREAAEAVRNASNHRAEGYWNFEALSLEELLTLRDLSRKAQRGQPLSEDELITWATLEEKGVVRPSQPQ